MRSILVFLVALAAAPALAQQPDRVRAAKAANLLTVEVLTPRDSGGFHAQKWAQAFERAGVAVTIRSERYGDKPSVTESKTGNSRTVKVLGRLDTRGQLVFPDRSFTEPEAAKLFKWLEDLRTFGPQGNPEGEPLWGLSKTQFGALHTALTPAVAADVHEQPLETALKTLAVPDDYPLRWTGDAKQVLADRAAQDVRQKVKGVSRGTALAAILNEAGLAFRPRRREDARIELEIVPLKEDANVWPVGWPLRKPQMETAPALFQYAQISLSKVELDSVLESAAEKVQLPCLIDYAAVEGQKIDLATKVSHPPKKAAWILALKDLTFQAKCRTEVWIDEAGKPFLYVTANAAPRRKNADPPIAQPGRAAVR